MLSDNDPADLNRFILAQESQFEEALAELASGQKRSHWMWFIFPQIAGLGQSERSRYYSIKNAAEAREYLNHPVLGPRLIKCTQVVMAIEGKTATEIFGVPDDIKLRSSMTLFANLSAPGSVFAGVLEKYFDGKWDTLTLDLLDKHLGWKRNEDGR
jgi:uncharacterized protein (DUF1810 family)